VAWSSTVFDTSHRDYLYGLHGSSLLLAADTLLPSGQIREQGADAVADLSANFDWRENACKGILYISDEPLDGNTTNSVTDVAIENAINIANENGVTVFTIFIPKTSSIYDLSIYYDQYETLSQSTGGTAFFDNKVDQATYINLMPKVVCNSCENCSLKTYVN